jgi:2-polyprenyl-3-methyl-5-hydroxy-6-metoxy-1,4-benzoquinol methylase
MKYSETETRTRSSKYYDELWTTLGERLHETELMRRDFIRQAIGRYAPKREITILDLGCGRGWLAADLADCGQVTGVDFSAKSLEIARSRFAARARFVLADPDSPTWGLPTDSKFDAVVCTEVIEHVQDAESFANQVRKMLLPGGVLLLTTPNGNVWDDFVHDRRFLHALQPVENWLTPSRLSQLLRSAGFKIIVHEGRAVRECRYGKRAWFQRRIFWRLIKLLGREASYYRAIVMSALCQVVVCRVTEGPEN